METKPLERGDIQIDDDGSEWYIMGVIYQEGKPKYSRLRVGSLAYQIHIGNIVNIDNKDGEKDGDRD